MEHSAFYQENETRKKIQEHTPISADEARWLFQYADDQLIQELATSVRRRFHQENQATYLIMAIINYTNVCVAGCTYCSFYKYPHESGNYVLNFEEVYKKVKAVEELGGTMAAFNGGFHPGLTLYDYGELFHKIHHNFPGFEFYEMTVAEFMFYCKRAKISYAEGVKILKEAGTRWVTGGGAEILDDTFRKRHSPGKYTVEDYYKAQKAVLDEGVGSTATMVIGFDESLEERMNHLVRLREFQKEVDGALTSFLCWTYKPYNNSLGGKEVSHAEYLRWLGVCRIFLDNFKHIRTSVLTQNENALKGLLYGANDFDLPIEDEVTQKAGATISLHFESLLQAARDLGFEPLKRAPFYPMRQGGVFP